MAQVVSATGDWLGLLAISLLAIRVGSGSEGASLSLVLAARIAPGFFFGPIAGVLVDRWNRKRVMVTCDVCRALVMLSLPFVETERRAVTRRRHINHGEVRAHLMEEGSADADPDVLSGADGEPLLLEAFTMMWSPAKEASVPHVVPEDQLASANSLSIVAAYGTFPLGAGLMVLFGRLSTALFDSAWADNLRLDEEGLAFYANALTFLLAAVLIATLPLPVRPKEERRAAKLRRKELAHPLDELREGWRFAFQNPVVRTVNMGLATGLIGGGMLVPLGAIYATDLLDAGDSGYGYFITALGLGVATGVALISLGQRRLDKARVFTWALVAAAVFLALSATFSRLHFSVAMVYGIGLCAGTVYVLGFTLLHENVDDNMRGRIFSTLYTLVRTCVLFALAIGPLLEESLDRLSKRFWERNVEVLGTDVYVPGVRLTLWLAAVIILVAGVVAVASLRVGERNGERPGGTS